MEIKVAVHDDGTVYFKDPSGNPLNDSLTAKVKKQYGNAIKDMIQKKCDEINGQVEELAKIHHYTPSPAEKPTFEPSDFPESQPRPPMPKTLGFLASLFRSKRERLEAENIARTQRFQEELASWQNQKAAFEQEQAARKKFIEQDIYNSIAAMESFLEESLQGISWPRETIVATEILDGGSRVFIDIDLPEIEDMPNKTANVPQRGYKLSVKDMSPAQVQRLYMGHVHGVGFRIIGEVFSSLPKAQVVVLSAFTQRPDKTTGDVRDEYLYAARVSRDTWSKINFNNLQSIDVVDALAQFDFRRDMTKTGAFKPIEPFAIAP